MPALAVQNTSRMLRRGGDDEPICEADTNGTAPPFSSHSHSLSLSGQSRNMIKNGLVVKTLTGDNNNNKASSRLGPVNTEYISRLETLSDPHHDWWWQRSASLLATLLRSAGSYTAEQQADHMRVYRDAVVPTFGPPTPQAGGVRPLLTMDGSPMEASWNFQNDGTVVRYSFEPLLPNDDPENPFPGDKVASLLPLLRYIAGGADTRWFEQIWDRWFLHDRAEVATARAALPPHRPRVPQIFLALDMKGAARMMKVYLFPVLKHLATGISTEELTWAAIRGLRPGGERFGRAVDKLAAFLAAYNDTGSTGTGSTSTSAIPVEMIAIDCVDPARARIKVYARTRTNSPATIRNVCTLGGSQVDDSTLRGVDHLCAIWHLLLDEPAGTVPVPDHDQSKPPRCPADHHLGICFVFEMRPDQDRIEVKCHLPWAQTNSSDIRALANFSQALDTLGYEQHSSKFARGALALATIPGLDLSKPGACSYVSYNYGRGHYGYGDYISTYLSPMCQGYDDCP